MSAPIVRLVGCPEALLQPLTRALLAAGLLPEGALHVTPEVIAVWLAAPPEAAPSQVRGLREGLWPEQPAIIGVSEPPPPRTATNGPDLDAWLASDDPEEIAHHCLMLARCRQRFLQTSPLTGLPGNTALAAEIERRLPCRGELAVLAFDLDHFKGYNDRYGYQRGDALLRWLAGLLTQVLSEAAARGWWLGHLGGDDFLGLVHPAEAPGLAQRVLDRFAAGIGQHYDPEDRAGGGIATRNRQGEAVWQPLVTLTIAQATNEADDVTHSGQLAAILAELKAYGKTLPGSRYVPDRRGIRSADAPGMRPAP